MDVHSPNGTGSTKGAVTCAGSHSRQPRASYTHSVPVTSSHPGSLPQSHPRPPTAPDDSSTGPAITAALACTAVCLAECACSHRHGDDLSILPATRQPCLVTTAPFSPATPALPVMKHHLLWPAVATEAKPKTKSSPTPHQSIQMSQ